jgi:hypothetical protein
MIMARAAEQEAKYALDYGTNRADLTLAAQMEYDRLVAEGYGAAQAAVATGVRPGVHERPSGLTPEYQQQIDRRRHERMNESLTDTYLRHIRNATCTLAVIAVVSVVLGIIGVIVVTSHLGDVVQCLNTQTSAGCTP